MTPSTRSSVKIQQTAAGEWRVIEGGESRRLTTEEMNDLVVQNSSLKQELDREMMEAKEKESMLEELGAELEELRRMRQSEEPNTDESQERKTDAESVEDAVEQKLAPFTELLTQLTRNVDQLSLRDGGMDDNNGPRQVAGAGPSATGRYAGFGRANDSTGSRDADGWGGIRIGEANRLYKDNLSAVMISKTGDANFASAHACWDRLIVQYPVDPIHQPKLVAHAFRGAAATVFQQIAAANTNASAQTLWYLMQGRLYNTAQVQSQRARFISATMKKDESVEEFAERLRQLASGLPETTTDDVLLQRLRDGLPSALKVNALAVTGEFYTVVSQVGQIADAMAVMRPRREQVNAVGGAIERTNGKRKGMSHTVGTRDKERTGDRTKPRGSRKNPVGFNPNDPEDVRPWNRARQ
jgi:Retrotransposon gag protein